MSFMNGLSALGQGMADYAAKAGLEAQKGDLLKQQAILADQLATARIQNVEQPFAASQQQARIDAENQRSDASNQTSLTINQNNIAANAGVREAQARESNAKADLSQTELAKVNVVTGLQQGLADEYAKANPDPVKIKTLSDQISAQGLTASTRAAVLNSLDSLARTEGQTLSMLTTQRANEMAKMDSMMIDPDLKAQSQRIVDDLTNQIESSRQRQLSLIEQARGIMPGGPRPSSTSGGSTGSTGSTGSGGSTGSAAPSTGSGDPSTATSDGAPPPAGFMRGSTGTTGGTMGTTGGTGGSTGGSGSAGSAPSASTSLVNSVTGTVSGGGSGLSTQANPELNTSAAATESAPTVDGTAATTPPVSGTPAATGGITGTPATGKSTGANSPVDANGAIKTLPGDTGTITNIDALKAARPDLNIDALKGYSPAVVGVVMGLIEGRATLPPLGSRAADAPKIRGLAMAVDPTLDEATSKARIETRKAFTSGPESKTITQINTTLGHAEDLAAKFKALNNTNIFPGVVNPVVNSIAQHIVGSARQNDTDMAINAVASEARKVFAGAGGGSLAELEEWKSTFPRNGSYAEQQSAVQHLVKLLDSRLQALGDQYNRGMQTTGSPMQFLEPHAKAVFEQLMGDHPLEPVGYQLGKPPAGAPAAATPTPTPSPDNRPPLADIFNQAQ